jgi:glycine hydroxymethyltransferase
MSDDRFQAILAAGAARLSACDPELYGLLVREQDRQAGTLSLVASCSVADPSVLACQASVAVNVTAEGYPGHRYHAGCGVIDEIERLAIARAQRVFGARYANIQPHSATTANYAVLSALLRPGETLLGMAVDSGGHLTHGSPAGFAGKYFNAVSYGTTISGLIDFGEVERLAAEHRPRVIICGSTAYPRAIDFARFREIADRVDAYLVADISHTAGLIAAGLHPSPVDHAHVTTTCTHKQLFGPRGGLIMSGRDHQAAAPRGSGTLAGFLQRAVFPFFQGAPAPSMLAAKAAALAVVSTPQFREVAQRIVLTAAAIARRLAELGYHVVSGGTDTHIVMVDLRASGISGLVAERALEECGIIVNKNRVPGDLAPPLVTGGIRIGTNAAAQRGMGEEQAAECAELIAAVLSAVRPLGERDYRLAAADRDAARARVAELTARFGLPGYPAGPTILNTGCLAASAANASSGESGVTSK